MCFSQRRNNKVHATHLREGVLCIAVQPHRGAQCQNYLQVPSIPKPSVPEVNAFSEPMLFLFSPSCHNAWDVI